MTPDGRIGIGLRASGDNSGSPDSPFGTTPSLPRIYVHPRAMYAGAVLNAVLSVFNALFTVLIHSLSWILSFLYLLVSPVLYLARGILELALFPLRLLLKFEVKSCCHNDVFLYTYILRS